MEYNTLNYEPTPNKSLATRLHAKFKNVPNVTLTDCETWVNDAIVLHGFKVSEPLPQDQVPLVIMLAQSLGARDIALQVAHYFSYTDGDESVDKTMLAEQYRTTANEFLIAYNNAKQTVNGVNFTIMKRADR